MIRERYRNNLRAAVGSSAVPYGYTLTTWTSGAVLMNALGTPDAIAALMFMFGAVSGFALVGTLAFGGMTKRYVTRSREAALWGGFHFPSVGLAIGAAWISTQITQSPFAWPLGAFLSTATYLLVLGMEATLTGARERE